MLALIFFALCGDWATPYDPFHIDTEVRLASPSLQHWFGTDESGRDILSRIIYGSRYTVLIALITVSISAIGGTLMGLPSAYFGGWADMLLMRIVDIMLSFPYILLTLAIVAMLGPSLDNAMIAIGVASMPGYARLTRSQVLALREQDFVTAARCVGVKDSRIMFLHILPNVLSTLLVFVTLQAPGTLLSAAALSFLGLGAQPPMPEWGAMMVNSRTFLISAPWVVLAPGLTIFIVILGLNIFGDALRDVLDPRVG